MIRASAEGFLADVSDSTAVRAAMISERGFDEALWQRLCREMYWPAIHIPEAYGGRTAGGRRAATSGGAGQGALL
ncbi:hypothetical protein ACYZTR_12800 [Pseudomonas sp. Hz4]